MAAKNGCVFESLYHTVNNTHSRSKFSTCMALAADEYSPARFAGQDGASQREAPERSSAYGSRVCCFPNRDAL